MHCKGRILGAAVALSTFAALTGANAHPASIGLALQPDNAAVIKVDYYYDRGYGYRESFGESLFSLPFKVIGGIGGFITGALDGAYYGSSYYPQPLYVSPYYGSPYYGNSYYNSPYNVGAYYFDEHYGSRYYGVHGYYSERRRYGRRSFEAYRGYYAKDFGYYEGDRGYHRGHGHHAYYADAYRDRGFEPSRDYRDKDFGYYGGRGYDGGHGHHDDAYYASAYSYDRDYGDRYKVRADDGAYDDDD